jgi:hypothetical protein
MTRPRVRVEGVLALLVLPALAWAQGPTLNARVAALEAAVAALQSRANAQGQRIAALETVVDTQRGQIVALRGQIITLQNSDAMKLNRYLSVTTDDLLGKPLILLTGVNLQLVNGEGPVQIEDESLPNYYDNPTLNGLGNLIVGYNETGTVLHGDLEVRTGSHNLVVGPGHTYSSYGGVVAGFMNRSTGVYATVTGGSENTASAPASSVSGGNFCRAQGNFSSVSGGVNNVASDFYSWAAGDLRWPKP